MCSFSLVLVPSQYKTLLLHWFRRRRVFNVLFSLCFGNMSCRHVTKTQGKQYVPNALCCFRYVLMTCLHEMLSEPMENNTFQPQSVRNQWNNNVLVTFSNKTIHVLIVPSCTTHVGGATGYNEDMGVFVEKNMFFFIKHEQNMFTAAEKLLSSC